MSGKQRAVARGDEPQKQETGDAVVAQGASQEAGVGEPQGAGAGQAVGVGDQVAVAVAAGASTAPHSDDATVPGSSPAQADDAHDAIGAEGGDGAGGLVDAPSPTPDGPRILGLNDAGEPVYETDTDVIPFDQTLVEAALEALATEIQRTQATARANGARLIIARKGADVVLSIARELTGSFGPVQVELSVSLAEL